MQQAPESGGSSLPNAAGLLPIGYVRALNIGSTRAALGGSSQILRSD